mgnify:FL=1
MPEPPDDMMTIILSNQISNVASRTTLDLNASITTMKASGMTDQAIKQALLNDLNTGGRLFGSLRSQFRSTVKNGVAYASNTSAIKEFRQAGVKEYRWQTVGKNICNDCKDRHGEIGTLEEIANIGLPGSGFSVCQSNCNCQLVPQAYTEGSKNEPIKVG